MSAGHATIKGQMLISCILARSLRASPDTLPFERLLAFCGCYLGLSGQKLFLLAIPDFSNSFFLVCGFWECLEGIMVRVCPADQNKWSGSL